MKLEGRIGKEFEKKSYMLRKIILERFGRVIVVGRDGCLWKKNLNGCIFGERNINGNMN